MAAANAKPGILLLLAAGIFAAGNWGRAEEEAVRAAPEWLRRHQNRSGSWSSFPEALPCDGRKGPCRLHPRNNVPRHGDARTRPNHEKGVTALAVLALNGIGTTHRFGPDRAYSEAVAKALAFLKQALLSTKEDHQDRHWLIDHAIATTAVARLLADSGDTDELKECVEKAAAICLRARSPASGWQLDEEPRRSDVLVTAWMVLALKTAKTCLDRGYISQPGEQALAAAFSGAVRWLDTVTDPMTGRVHGTKHTDFTPDQPCMTAAGIIARLFAGQKRKEAVIEKGIAYLMEHTPRWDAADGRHEHGIDFMYWYLGTLAVYQVGGARWRTWNQRMQEALLPTQRMLGDTPQGGCEDGSWDPIGRWCASGGRVYATALNAMTLEVYYRFQRLQEEREDSGPSTSRCAMPAHEMELLPPFNQAKAYKGTCI